MLHQPEVRVLYHASFCLLHAVSRVSIAIYDALHVVEVLVASPDILIPILVCCYSVEYVTAWAVHVVLLVSFNVHIVELVLH